MTEAIAVIVGAAIGAVASWGTTYTVERQREERAKRAREAEQARQARIARRLVRQELNGLRHRAAWDSERWTLPTPAWDAWGAHLAAELPEDLFEPIASAYISLKGGGMVDAVTHNLDRAVTALERWTGGATAQTARSAQSEA